MENLWRGGAGTSEYPLRFFIREQGEQPHAPTSSFQPWWNLDLHPRSDKIGFISTVEAPEHLPSWLSEKLKPIDALVDKLGIREDEAARLSGFIKEFKEAGSPEEAREVLQQTRNAYWNTIRKALPPGSEHPIEAEGGRSRAEQWHELFDKEFDKIEKNLMQHFSELQALQNPQAESSAAHTSQHTDGQSLSPEKARKLISLIESWLKELMDDGDAHPSGGGGNDHNGGSDHGGGNGGGGNGGAGGSGPEGSGDDYRNSVVTADRIKARYAEFLQHFAQDMSEQRPAMPESKDRRWVAFHEAYAQAPITAMRQTLQIMDLADRVTDANMERFIAHSLLTLKPVTIDGKTIGPAESSFKVDKHWSDEVQDEKAAHAQQFINIFHQQLDSEHKRLAAWQKSLEIEIKREDMERHFAEIRKLMRGFKWAIAFGMAPGLFNNAISTGMSSFSLVPKGVS